MTTRKWRCYGNFCPDELSAINKPGFTIRAGIIPYSLEGGGRLLLGVKNGLYCDFGGGCKMKKGEKPFECAHREFTEETLGLLQLDPKNITHVIVSGGKQPHQTVLMVRVDGESFGQDLVEKYSRAEGFKELTTIRFVPFATFNRMTHRDFSMDLKSIFTDVKGIVSSMRA